MSRPDSLLVTGGQVLAGGKWTAADVFLANGRIVSVGSDVRTSGTGGGPGEPTEVGTAGAGAERAALRPFASNETATAAGSESPAAGGVSARRLDASGLLVVPGFLDLQCNGAVGVDITAEPERLWDVAAALPRWGVTAWLPTVVTAPAATRVRALAALRSGRAGDPAGPAGARPVAVPLGLHLEGPFLAPERRGAHPAEHLRAPDAAMVADERWTRDAGVALVTLAPELPGALDLVRTLVAAGVVVSAGHSSASAEQATVAIDAGVTAVTHLFNAMGPLHHRDPGLAGVALTDERVRVGAIADGVHLHPTAVALAARALGERLCLVTDAVAALGMPEGRVRLGVLEAFATADGVRLADGTLAGTSDLSLDRAVRNLVGFAGVPLAAAVAAVTASPAALVGLEDRGVIAPGAVGDLVLLDAGGEVVATVIGGRVAYDRREGPWRS
ncbi:MAG TPA: N-acetylglucosamine-6-phosphate deacetylase [Acidimicrobiales bacterium]|nr:N-acetylglucosamine-6-phosphate deacetylase [Acidimicrobiales bacterium]